MLNRVQTARPDQRAGEHALCCLCVSWEACAMLRAWGACLQCRSCVLGALRKRVLCCKRVLLKSPLKNYCPLAVSPPECLLKAART